LGSIKKAAIEKLLYSASLPRQITIDLNISKNNHSELKINRFTIVALDRMFLQAAAAQNQLLHQQQQQQQTHHHHHRNSSHNGGGRTSTTMLQQLAAHNSQVFDGVIIKVLF
jgi:hypothetical protein